MKLEFFKPKRIVLKSHPDYSEKWVQSIIAEDPTMLGLGDLVLRDQERMQPRAGRLDLLLQDEETKRRYEVELQLGTIDEQHIIRTIEYWDIERKRYPQYDHCAVIIAEDVTSRFLNVIGLFNGQIPIIAIQMQAFEIDGRLTLVFSKILDELQQGYVDADEDAQVAPTDRAYWEARASKQTLSIADELLLIVNEFDEEIELKYNKFYIGLSKNRQAFNFITFRPKKTRLNLEIKLPKSDEIDAIIEEHELDALEYRSRWGQYNISISEDEIRHKRDTIKRLAFLAYELRTA